MALYATVAELKQLGINAAAFAGIGDSDLLKAISAASARAEGYLRKRYRLPLHEWNDNLTEAVCALAAWRILSARRGFNPKSGSDAAIRTNYEDAIAWLRSVADETLDPPDVKDSTPVEDVGAYVVSEPRREW
jgi:phage gp36-like protein